MGVNESFYFKEKKVNTYIWFISRLTFEIY